MSMTIPWWNVNIGDEAAEAAAGAIRGRQISMGALTEEFEERMARLLNVEHVVAVTSGTSALLLALWEAGAGPGTEVIVPDRTWIASAHAPLMLGARVVLADVDSRRVVLTPEAFAAAITPRTRAVVAVHLNGLACDMRRITAIAEEHDIAVIEDAAQALFSCDSQGNFLGTGARSGCFSLSTAKIITSGQGGFVATRDADTARHLRLMRTHGTMNVIEPQWIMQGGNFRFTDVLAAVAMSQLDIYKQRIEGVRRTNAFYAERLPTSPLLRLQYPNARSHELPLYVEAYSPCRKEVMTFLHQKGVQCRPLYESLHTAPQFASPKKDFPHADALGRAGFFLPSGPDRTREELDYTVAALNAWLNTQ